MAEAYRGLGRHGGLDAARGWAMLLGVVIHAIVPYTHVIAYAWPVVSKDSHIVADWIFHALHTFRNPLFFLVSGLLARAVTIRVGRDEYLRKRVRRLWWPLVLCASIVAPVAEIAAHYARQIAGTMPVNFTNLRFWNDRAAYLAEQANPATAEPLWPMIVEWYGPIPETLRYWRLGIFWFLWFALLLSYFGPPLIAWISRRLGARREAVLRTFDRAMRSWWAPAWVGLLLYPPLAIGYGIELSTPASVALPFPFALLSPDVPLIAYYFVFFATGWTCQPRPEWMASAKRHNVTWLAIAVVAFTASFVYANHYDSYLLADYWRVRLIAQIGYVIGSAGFTLGLFGSFLRWHPNATPSTQFLMEASFWVYLIHIPVLTLLQAVLVPLAWHWVPELVFQILAGGAICLASYRWLVAGTVVDRILTGAGPARAS